MQLTKEQSKQFEEFISKIEVSKVRSDIERLWDTVKDSGYIFKTEQLDELKDLATHLPTELQTFPQVFSHWVKNDEHTERQEEINDTQKKAKANLADHSGDILKGVKVKDKDTEDKTVSEYDDMGNKASDKLLPAREQEIDIVQNEIDHKEENPDKAIKPDDVKKQKALTHTEKMTKEAKKGDLHRTKKATSKDTPVPTYRKNTGAEKEEGNTKAPKKK